MTTDSNNHTPRHFRAMLIDPVSRTITEVQVLDDHKAIVDWLNCNVFDFVHLTPDGTEVMAVDDEGRLTYPNPNGYFRFVHPYKRTPMSGWTCGRGLVMGSNPQTGEATDSGLMLATIVSAVEYATEPPPRDEVKPMFSIHPLH